MVKHLEILIISFFSNFLFSQNWVEKNYDFTKFENITYGSSIDFAGDEVSLKLDVFIPNCSNTNNTSKLPLLLWIHGGSFLAGDKNDVSIQDMCTQFASRGYVTATIDYRLGFIADDKLWQCNYPNYSCVFAADSAEWVRAYYRAVQDAKGALRYLINRHEEFNIDVNNAFVAGESAGAITALGVGLLDVESEKLHETFGISSVIKPNTGTQNCIYNTGKTYDNSEVERPDLGTIDGQIEPTSINYTIKGIGNFYGAMFSDLLKQQNPDKTKPAIYSFHQPCDIIVPIDSAFVNWGLSWCFTNGYNCNAIRNNNVMLYGSRTFNNWNDEKNYGYNIHNEFTSVNFPYNFLFGQGSCLDQVNNPCHAYDNKTLRENNLATFFAPMITSDLPCSVTSVEDNYGNNNTNFNIFPNPTDGLVSINSSIESEPINIEVFNQQGISLINKYYNSSNNIQLDLSLYPKGLYLLKIINSKTWRYQYGKVRLK